MERCRWMCWVGCCLLLCVGRAEVQAARTDRKTHTSSLAWAKKRHRTRKVARMRPSRRVRRKRRRRQSTRISRRSRRFAQRAARLRRRRQATRASQRRRHQRTERKLRAMRIALSRARRQVLHAKKELARQRKQRVAALSKPSTPRLWGRPWGAMPLRPMLQHAKSLRAQKMPLRAVAFLERLLRHRYHPSVVLALGESARDGQRWSRALSAFLLLKRMEVKPKWQAWAMYGLGSTQLKRDNTTLARFHFYKLTSLFPKTRAALGGHYGLARLAIRKGEWRGAVSQLRECGMVRRDRYFGPLCLKTMGQIQLEKRGARFAAIKAYEQLAERYRPHAADAFLAIAKIYDKLEDRSNAIRYYRRVLKRDPYHVQRNTVKKRLRRLTGIAALD